MVLGAWGNRDADECIRIVHAALDAGINFVDTADIYAFGESEEIVGRALEGRRDDVVLATKFFNAMGEDPNHRGASRRWIVRAVEDSLRRLRDRLDRPLPGAPARSRPPIWTRRSARCPTSCTPARSVRSARRRSRPRLLVEAQWTAERRGHVRPVDRAAAVLHPRPRRRARGAADVPALRARRAGVGARSTAAG